jgi:HD superfamily phosphodiesterase
VKEAGDQRSSATAVQREIAPGSAAGRAGSPPIGSLAWGSRGRGALTLGEQLTLARQAILAQIADLPSFIRASLARKSADSAMVVGRKPPDTKLAQRALELAGETSSSPLLGHCLRCWLWADLFSQRDMVAVDEELLYVACILHDLALTDTFRAGPLDQVDCFAVRGGEVARDMLLEFGAERPFSERVAEAITLHMNVRVPRGLGGEAHLLHAAAHLDVAGTRAGEIAIEARAAILQEHPRDRFAAEFGRLMLREKSERPRSRAALLWRLGMKLPLTHNPLDRGG